MSLDEEITQALTELSNVSTLIYKLGSRIKELSNGPSESFDRVFLSTNEQSQRFANVVSQFNKKPKKKEIIVTSEEIEMLIKIPGVSICNEPRKDGRFQGYVTIKGKRTYVYGFSKNELYRKIKYIVEFGPPKQRKVCATKTENGVPNTFNSFATYYFKHFRKKTVSHETYRADNTRYLKYIKPTFEEKHIKNVTSLECQNLIESITKQGKTKTAEAVFSLLSVIFKMAIKHGLITRNPLDIVIKVRHERKHGTALTKEEESYFTNALSSSPYASVFALALYTGLRPNELSTARIDGAFIIAINSKRKTRKTEYKKIPICDKLAPYLIQQFQVPKLDLLRRHLKDLLPNHILYDLRTTFYSRCKECNLSMHAINAFMGHSLGELGNAYTDLSDEFLIEEMKKFKY